ncbi:class I SAM-dependent methyltransferase [Bacteroidota bacterium]
MENKIYLPGSRAQLELLFQNLDVSGLSALVMGSSSEEIAKAIAKQTGANVELIVEDLESMMNSKLLLEDSENINVRIMEFDVTDFEDNTFDLVYAQASVSSSKRNQIVKEIKRILKDDSCFCVGEIVKLKNDVPPFIQNVFDESDLNPILIDELNNYYTQRKFSIVYEVDLSDKLREYYMRSIKKLNMTREELEENEKSYYKKLLNKISHESNVYLKQGGDKVIGLKMLLLKKGTG